MLLLFALSRHRKNFFPVGNYYIPPLHTVPSAATTRPEWARPGWSRMEKVTGRKSISADTQGWNTADCSTDYHPSHTNQEDIQTKSFQPQFGWLAFLEKKAYFCKQHERTAGSYRLSKKCPRSCLLYREQFISKHVLPRRLARSRLSPSYNVTERGILWKRSPRDDLF